MVSQFLSHVLRNFIEEPTITLAAVSHVEFLSHVLRNFIEERRSTARSPRTRDS